MTFTFNHIPMHGDLNAGHPSSHLINHPHLSPHLINLSIRENMPVRVTRVPEEPLVEKLEDGPVPLIWQVGLRGLVNVGEHVGNERVNLRKRDETVLPGSFSRRHACDISSCTCALKTLWIVW